MKDLSQLSHQETLKDQSKYLEGKIVEELNDGTAIVSDDTYELLKFHGTYFGYNRDTQTARKQAGLDKEWEFMVRLRIPAGHLTSQQYLDVEKIADQYANKTVRLTTRQTIQLHCITKDNLKNTISDINKALLSTLSACGDVVRNITASNAPFATPQYKRLQSDAHALAKHFEPHTTSYVEIWTDAEGKSREGDDVEPIYGKHYLPRKFKIGLAIPEDNGLDVLSHDIAAVLVFEGDVLKGYNIYVGGGYGATHNKPETYPRLATPLCFVGEGELLKISEAIVKLQRDYGDRKDRKHARLKYVVQERGIEWVKETLERDYYGQKLQPLVPTPAFKVPDLLGWHEQGDGNWFLGLPISSGRIVDRGEERIKSAMHAIATQFAPRLVVTADQNIILADVKPEDKAGIDTVLKVHGVKQGSDITEVYKYMIACVALPTCGKALAEAERIKLPLLSDIEQVMDKNGILSERISIRIAGCPNGCSRPYSGDIGIIGRMPGHYVIHIGGDFEGTRLNTKVFDKVPMKEVPAALDPMFALYAKEKNPGEGFGDFCHRVGIERVAGETKKALGAQHKWAA